MSYKNLLILLVLFHYVIFISFLLTCVLSFVQLPWYIALTMNALIFRVIFSRTECPLTTLENYYRLKLSMKPSQGFLKDYVINIKQTVQYLKNAKVL